MLKQPQQHIRPRDRADEEPALRCVSLRGSSMLGHRPVPPQNWGTLRGWCCGLGVQSELPDSLIVGVQVEGERTGCCSLVRWRCLELAQLDGFLCFSGGDCCGLCVAMLGSGAWCIGSGDGAEGWLVREPSLLPLLTALVCIST